MEIQLKKRRSETGKTVQHKAHLFRDERKAHIYNYTPKANVKEEETHNNAQKANVKEKHNADLLPTTEHTATLLQFYFTDGADNTYTQSKRKRDHPQR